LLELTLRDKLYPVSGTETRAVMQNKMLGITRAAVEFSAEPDERTDIHLSVT
jgi:hypothetical protein